VPALRDLQANVRDALVLGGSSGLESILIGGVDPPKRLAIHQRHYQASLVTALLDRFPATIWLVGSDFVRDAAARFVRGYPPDRPCIAEYGEEFPRFLTTRPGAGKLPYLRPFAELEWHVGRVSLAVDAPPLTMADLEAIDASALADARMTLQSGLHYLHADCGIDELLSLYLADSVPEEFLLIPGDVWLELHGVRGQLRMTRLSRGDFAFRLTLASGRPVADAAATAFDVEPAFDAGRGLLELVGNGMLVAIHRTEGAA
jgi:hypothetical protein